MNIALDTNVVVRLINRGDARHEAAERRLQSLTEGGHTFFIAPQILYEFWAVATRGREANGLGWSVSEAEFAIQKLLLVAGILPDPDALWPRWLSICVQHGITGKQAHDARLVAWMRMHGITTLCTFNVHHFAHFSGIQMIDGGAPA